MPDVVKVEPCCAVIVRLSTLTVSHSFRNLKIGVSDLDLLQTVEIVQTLSFQYNGF